MTFNSDLDSRKLAAAAQKNSDCMLSSGVMFHIGTDVYQLRHRKETGSYTGWVCKKLVGEEQGKIRPFRSDDILLYIRKYGEVKMNYSESKSADQSIELLSVMSKKGDLKFQTYLRTKPGTKEIETYAILEEVLAVIGFVNDDDDINFYKKLDEFKISFHPNENGDLVHMIFDDGINYFLKHFNNRLLSIPIIKRTRVRGNSFKFTVWIQDNDDRNIYASLSEILEVLHQSDKLEFYKNVDFFGVAEMELVNGKQEIHIQQDGISYFINEYGRELLILE